ncbi:MAG: AMP-binding protein [Catenulispora sp.]|nr:AMP-binding protein [Catenulispora sp.]
MPGPAGATIDGGGSPLAVAATLVRAGVIRPGPPHRSVGQLRALMSWGATIAGGFRAAAARTPNAEAVIDERVVLTYRELTTRATRLANGLQTRGVEPGDKVALLCRNHAGMVICFIACAELGVDAVLLNTGLSAGQLTQVLEEQRPKAVIADTEFDAVLTGCPPEALRVNSWHEPGAAVPLTLDDVIDNASAAARRPPDKPGRIIVLTSGTTGAPKGARRPNPPGIGAAASILSRIPLRAGDRILVPAPMFHSWGLAALQISMPLRATLIMQRRFDPEATLKAIQTKRPTAVFAVPVMVQRMLDLGEDVIKRYDTSSLRVVALSGSAIPAASVTRFLDTFGPVLYNLYGSTEVSWASIADPADLRQAPTTAGRPPLSSKVLIRDVETGEPVPTGRVGRIFVWNDMLFDGYTNGASKEVSDGYMATGDRGYVDAHGLLFVCGRDDDMIVSGGENVFPREVEELIAAQPGVRECAVVGVPDEEWGQRFAAYIALLPGVTMTEEEVKALVKRSLARFSVPRDVHFVDELPRNATGKVVNRLLGD